MLDIVIIGSGPAGLSAAIYAKRANLSLVVVEKDYMGTGQIVESHQVDNYIGLAGKSGYDLGETFRQDALNMGVEFMNAEVVQLEKEEDGYKVVLSQGEALLTKTVIYCAGASHRPLGIESEAAYIGKGVSYCAQCDGAFFKDKPVAVVGGGDTALDDALYLAGLCSKVYLVHRREEFRGSAATLSKIREQDNIELVTSAQVTEISGEKKVESLTLNNGRTLTVSGIFVAVGMIPQIEPVKLFVTVDESGYIVAGEDCRTSAEGIYAAGDVRTKPLRQVVTAVADGANAAVAAADYVRMK